MFIDDIQRRVYIDNKRLRDELIYYKFYGERPNYNNILTFITCKFLILILRKEMKFELIQKYVKYFKKGRILI